MLVTTGVVKGIRDYSSIFFFKIGGILDIEFNNNKKKWKQRFAHST